MRKKHKWIIFACVSVFMLLLYPLLREMYFGFWAGSPERYLSERRKDEFSRFAEEMLRNSQNAQLAVMMRQRKAAKADGPTSAAEIESIKKLLRKHRLHRFDMDRRSGSVRYSHCFIRIWLEYIYVADDGHLPTGPESRNLRKVAEHWYFTAW